MRQKFPCTKPKNKKGGVVNSTVMGVGALVIAVIIILVIVSTIIGANLFDEYRHTISVANVTLTIVDDRTGGVALPNATLSGASCSLTETINATGGQVINSANYTTTGCNITAAAGSEFNGTAWNVSTTTTYDGGSERTVLDMNDNFTEGIGKVSAKIPTILLVVAVVFLFGALILLMKNARSMGIGEGSSL